MQFFSYIKHTMLAKDIEMHILKLCIYAFKGTINNFSSKSHEIIGLWIYVNLAFWHVFRI